MHPFRLLQDSELYPAVFLKICPGLAHEEMYVSKLHLSFKGCFFTKLGSVLLNLVLLDSHISFRPVGGKMGHSDDFMTLPLCSFCRILLPYTAATLFKPERLFNYRFL